MKTNTINQQSCIKCQLCIKVCPVNMIGMDKNGEVNFIPEREHICLECGQCMAVCSTDSVKIKKYTYAENFRPLPDHRIDYFTFIDFIASRRSIRNFKDKLIEESLFNKILDSLQYAPYGAEPNKVEITVINNRQIIEQALPPTEKFLDDIIGWVDSPIVSRIIKFKKGKETFNTLKNHLYPMSKLENYKLKYGDRITRGAPALMLFHADTDAEEHTHNALIYATYAMFTAHAMGLGTMFNGIMPPAINKIPKLHKLFNIPQNHEVIISLILGYPKYKYRKTVRRDSKRLHYIQ